MEPVRPSFGVNISPVLFLSSGSAWSLSIDKTIEFYSQQIFLSSGSAWSLSKQGIFSSAMGFNFYPQAPHGACLCYFQYPTITTQFLSSGSAWSLSSSTVRCSALYTISILRLRMEPVGLLVPVTVAVYTISILRLRMEPVSKKHQKYVL